MPALCLDSSADILYILLCYSICECHVDYYYGIFHLGEEKTWKIMYLHFPFKVLFQKISVFCLGFFFHLNISKNSKWEFLTFCLELQSWKNNLVTSFGFCAKSNWNKHSCKHSVLQKLQWLGVKAMVIINSARIQLNHIICYK